MLREPSAKRTWMVCDVFKELPLARFSVGDHPFVGPRKPLYLVRSVNGRATRCFSVVEEGSLCPSEVFLKDMWRRTADGMEREGDVYTELWSKQVRNLLRLHAHGDVDGRWQTTCYDGLDKDTREGLSAH
jgi:hypothetical protein